MKLLLTFSLVLLSAFSFGQINFVSNTTPWEQLSQMAKNENLLIFIHFENSKCEQCNEVASQGFSESILKEKFENNFISVRVNVGTENGRKLVERLQIKGELLSAFVDPDGNILHVFNGSTSSGMTYAEQADIAIGRKGQKQLKDFDREYQAGERSPGFMKAYMMKRKEATIAYDDLLDEYVSGLPKDSLKSLETVKFIYSQGPVLNSTSFKLVHENAPAGLIPSIYRSIPFDEAVAMNNAIISNSFRNAVRDRNEELAYQTALFTRNTYDNDRAKGTLAFQGSLARYFYFVKDTAKYIAQARQLMEGNHLRLTADSLKKMDEAMFKKMHQSQIAAGGKNQLKTFKMAPPSQFFHIELNEHAWKVYELSRKTEDLETALLWSKRSIDLFDELQMARPGSNMSLGNPNYLDTYAHILYKMGRKEEAVEWQTKAVEAQKITGMAHASFENKLNKMKAGTL